MPVMRIRSSWAAGAIGLALFVTAACGGARTETPAATPTPDPPAAAPTRSPDVIFVPTRDEVVEGMLNLAKVSAKDVVYDMGSGDGKIVIAAARRGARGTGIDIDPQRIAEANANAKAAGVTHLVTFKLEDAMTTDVSQATVVTLYLLSSSNLKLRPILTRQLKPGTRIVAHNFAMGDWEAEKIETFQDKEGRSRTIYRWTADGRVRQ